MSGMTKLEQLQKYLTAAGISAELREHAVHKELQSLNPKIREKLQEVPKIIPDYQIIATGDKGEISVIHCGASFYQFEIYCLNGDLFDGIRRYKRMTDAARTIIGLLTKGTFDETIPRSFDVWTDWIFSQPDGSVQPIIDFDDAGSG